MAKGSVIRRKGRKKWSYRFYIIGEDGKPKQIERVETESRAETERLLRQAIAEYEAKQFIAQNSNLTLAGLIDLWIEESLRPSNYSHGTVGAYTMKVNRIKRYPLAQRKLKTITCEHLQAFIDLLSFGGTAPDGTPVKALVPGTVKNYMVLLNKVFKFAIFPKRLLTVNPMEYVVRRSTPNMDGIFVAEDGADDSPVLSPEQYRILTSYLEKRRNPALLPVQISYYAGLRLGEVCGLAWEDIDLDAQCMTIRRSLKYTGARKATSLGPTKSKRPRTVDFGDTLAEILRKAKVDQAKASLQYGPLYKVNYHKQVNEKGREYHDLYTLPQSEVPPEGYTPISFVCVRRDGGHLYPSTITSLFQDLSKNLPGLGHFHFHILRHTYTSNLLKSGAAPKDVQELLGHADISTTMNIYAHAERASKQAAAKLLDKLASGE